MQPLIESTALAQKWGKKSAGIFVSGIFFAYLNARIHFSLPSWLDLGVGLLFLGQLLKVLLLELRRKQQRAAAALRAGLFVHLLLLSYGALLFLPGGIDGPYYPLVYIVLMMAAGLGSPRTALLSAGAAALMELCLRASLHRETSWDESLVRLGFLGAFALLQHLFFRAEVARVRRLGKEQLDGELMRIEKAARAFRLSGGTESPSLGGDAQAASAHAAVGEVQKSAAYALRILAGAYQLHSAALLSLDKHGQLTVLESTAETQVDPGPYSAASGAFSVACTRAQAVEVIGPRAQSHLPYLKEGSPFLAVRMVPLLEEGSVKALLVVTRREAEKFDEASAEVLRDAGHYLMRAIQNERVYHALEHASRQQSKLYRAASALGEARSEAEVIEIGVESARDVAAFDFAAVTLFDKKSGLHEICAVSAEGSEHLVGQTFRQNAGLVSMAVATGQALPFKGQYEPARQLVFARGYEPPKMPSLLVLPLVVHDRVLGTLLLGSERPGAFQKGVRPALEVLASHMAVSLSSARMLQRLEEQATTDGMTGLLNKRTLIAEAEKKLKSAARFKKNLSLLVTDIDFFKKVNDTYGHDVGDLVIKGLGDLLKRVKRDTDIVGRFGGEEFVIVCEQTDEGGAMQLAERIRSELEKTTFQTELGPLSVTGSVGVATFPQAGRSYDALFKACDEALYVSKRNGRNQVNLWKQETKSQSKAG